MAGKPTNNSNRSVADLHVYQLALELEDKVYKLAKDLPADRFEMANGLRRAAAGTAHYIYESYRRYSYQVKIESLHAARGEAEAARELLVQVQEAGFSKTGEMCEGFTVVVKQTWGLIKYLKRRQEEKQQAESVQAKEEMVAARA